MTRLSGEYYVDGDADTLLNNTSPLQFVGTENGTLVVATEDGTTLYYADGTSDSFTLPPNYDSSKSERKAF